MSSREAPDSEKQTNTQNNNGEPRSRLGASPPHSLSWRTWRSGSHSRDDFSLTPAVAFFGGDCQAFYHRNAGILFLLRLAVSFPPVINAMSTAVESILDEKIIKGATWPGCEPKVSAGGAVMGNEVMEG